ncbi:hypothetical protein FEQ05_01152 [Burkholderia pseudomultivorans]|nr:hypothetical protein [Burkholderia pseudomultivorans]MDR8817451.1 hypothetical protein [Burkholderia pseudomultivorans]
MQRRPVVAALCPVSRLLLIPSLERRVTRAVRVLQRFIALPVRVVTDLLRDRLRRRLSRVDQIRLVAQHLLQIRRLVHRAVQVRRISIERPDVLLLIRFVRDRDVADTDRALRRRATAIALADKERQRTAGVLPALRSMRRVVVPSVAHAAARADPDTARVVFRTILDIRERQRPGRLPVLVLHRCTRDIRSLQVRIAADLDIEATVSRLNALLLVHPRIAAARAAGLHADIRARTAHACIEPTTRTVLACGTRARVLHRREIQVAANICDHLVRHDVCADDIGIAAADDRRGIARIDMRVVLRRRIRVRITLRPRHRRRHSESARAIRHAETRALRCRHADNRMRRPAAIGCDRQRGLRFGDKRLHAEYTKRGKRGRARREPDRHSGVRRKGPHRSPHACTFATSVRRCIFVDSHQHVAHGIERQAKDSGIHDRCLPEERAAGDIALASMPPAGVTRYLQLSIARPLMPPAVGA